MQQGVQSLFFHRNTNEKAPFTCGSPFPHPAHVEAAASKTSKRKGSATPCFGGGAYALPTTKQHRNSKVKQYQNNSVAAYLKHCCFPTRRKRVFKARENEHTYEHVESYEHYARVCFQNNCRPLTPLSDKTNQS